jgi:hypothetical protein
LQLPQDGQDIWPKHIGALHNVKTLWNYLVVKFVCSFVLYSFKLMIPMSWHGVISAHLTLIQWHFKIFAVGSQEVTECSYDEHSLFDKLEMPHCMTRWTKQFALTHPVFHRAKLLPLKCSCDITH